MIDFWTRGDCTPASPRHRTTCPVGGQHCATSPQSCMQSHRLWLFTDLDQLQALQTACAVPLLLRTRRCSEPGIDDDSERGMRLGIMMTPNLDLRWDHIAILASSSWLEPKKFALTACLLWWFSCDSHLGFLETYFLFRISSQHLTTHFVNHIIVVPLHMSTFFVPGIPARSGHPGVFEELQNDGEGQEGQAWGVLLHLEASEKNRNSHFLKTVHFFI